MRVGRLVGTCADAVADRVAGLPGIARLCETVPHEAVELGQACAGTAVGDGAVVHVAQPFEQLLVAWVEVAGADVLRVVAPVAVGADPDLEQRRLVLLHGPAARRRERADSRPGPHERVAERELDLAFPPRPLAVHEAFPECRRLALLHPRPELTRP